MRSAVLLVAGVLAFAAGCGSTPATPTEAYLQGVSSLGVDADPALAETAGREGCAQLDGGLSPAAAGAGVGTVLGVGGADGVGVLRLAAATWCPQHLDAVRAAAQS